MAAPMTDSSRRLVLLLGLGALVLIACERGEGESCQVNSDCEDPLICERIQGGADRSECRRPEDVETPDTSDAGVGDAGPLPDDGDDGGVQPDAAIDAATDDDAGDSEDPDQDAG